MGTDDRCRLMRKGVRDVRKLFLGESNEKTLGL